MMAQNDFVGGEGIEGVKKREVVFSMWTNNRITMQKVREVIFRSSRGREEISVVEVIPRLGR